MFRQAISYLKNAQPNKLVLAATGVGACAYAYNNPSTFNQPLNFMKNMELNNMFTPNVASADQHVLIQGQNSVQAVPVKAGRKHFKDELIQTANKLAATGKGILAADEAPETMVAKFNGIGVDPTTENLRAYRELLFTAPEIEKYISGVIMFDTTMAQRTSDGSESFKDVLDRRGIIIGMNVDKGFTTIGGTTGEENATMGLDGLAERCQEYYSRGVRFCKWRGTVKIDATNGGPTELSINETAYTLCRYAGIAQDNGICPIIEPEVVLDGTHSLEECERVSGLLWARVQKQMEAHRIIQEGCIIKPNMVTPGAQYTGTPATSQEISEATVRVLRRCYVPAIPGIMFLSGGQSEADACLNLNGINKVESRKPWALSFCYGRALQASVLKAWKGKDVAAGQAALLERSRANSLASQGTYVGDGGADTRLYTKNYVY